MLNQSHLLSLPKQRGSSVLVCDDPGSSYPTNLLSRVTWGNYRRMKLSRNSCGVYVGVVRKCHF